jgi:hypothetical protein
VFYPSDNIVGIDPFQLDVFQNLEVNIQGKYKIVEYQLQINILKFGSYLTENTHDTPITNIIHWILFMEKVTVSYEAQTNAKNKLYRQNAVLFNLKGSGIHTHHSHIKG